MKKRNLFGLSGGKDSTALWAWAINESGYDPSTILGSFSDTENEYPEVHDQIGILNAYGLARGVPPIRVLRSMGFLNLAIWKGRFLAAKSRFCTEHLKIIPLRHLVEELQLEGYELLSHSGVRRDESIERSTMTEFSESGGLLGIPQRRPLLELKLADVWAYHKKYGLPINRLYSQGRRRVGCKLCIMSNKEDIRQTVLHHPEVIDEYRQWEKVVGEARSNRGMKCKISSFFRRNTVPLAQRSTTITAEDGRVLKVCTIDDVARWSQTVRGGVQGGFDFMFDEVKFDLDDAHAPCKSGYCE